MKQMIQDYYDKYEYWVRLFMQTQTKIYVSWFKYDARHCIIADALQSLGGVSVIYQRAFEESSCPGTRIAVDIVFGFSQQVAMVEQRTGSDIPYYVVTGYLGDYRFPFLKPIALNIKEQLQRAGAKKILAYFDEGSGADSRWHTGHEFMRENYAFLLEKILSEPWLGVVFKPKVPATLISRLGPLRGLFERAEKTGRCYVFSGGALHSFYPPSVAALAADIAVHGHLCAATAGLEAALAGVPTLLLDREGWPDSSLYQLKKGRVVFTDWEPLWETCQRYWNNQSVPAGFGDWSGILDALDPFRDGRAAERMGTYLHWLLEGFKQEQERQTVMRNAAERYAEIWGNDKVIDISYSMRDKMPVSQAV
jgi:hypothetical protein